MKQQESLKQLKSMDSKELAKELSAANKHLVELKFGAKLRKLKNYKEIKNERKKIARIWTLMAEKALEKLIQEEVGEGKAKNAK